MKLYFSKRDVKNWIIHHAVFFLYKKCGQIHVNFVKCCTRIQTFVHTFYHEKKREQKNRFLFICTLNDHHIQIKHIIVFVE
jgi:hypothetical protein